MTEQDGFNCRCRPKPERRTAESLLRFRGMMHAWNTHQANPDQPSQFQAFCRAIEAFERYMAEHELEERYRYEVARGGTE